MPAEKSSRSSQKKRDRNRGVRSTVRTYVALANEAMGEEDGKQGEAAVKRAILHLDKAAKRGIVHSNNAARRKSRLMKKLNSLHHKG